MGLNFYAVCHRHREMLFIVRPHENEALHSFYRAHSDCFSRHTGGTPDNFQVMADAADRAFELEEDGYTQRVFPSKYDEP